MRYQWASPKLFGFWIHLELWDNRPRYGGNSIEFNIILARY